MDKPLQLIRANGFRLVPKDRFLNIDFSQKPNSPDLGSTVKLSHRVTCNDRLLVNLISILAVALAEPKPFRRMSGRDISTIPTQRDSLGILPVNVPLDPSLQWSEKLRTVLESLGYPLQEERSIRVTPGQFESNRFLLGLERRQLLDRDLGRVKDLLCTLAFSEDFLIDFSSLLPQCDWIHFGFESGLNGLLFKLYLESDNIGASEPYIRHHAWKWSPITKQGIHTSYMCYPGISSIQIKDRINFAMRRVATGSWVDLASSCEDFCSYIVDLFCTSLEQADQLFLEVNESSSLRHSFDLGFYGSGLRVCDIEAPFRKLCLLFSLDMSRVDLLLEQVRGYELGHIASGIHNSGQPFCTLYFGAQARGIGQL